MMIFMKKYQHLFFDMDMTITPSRQSILPEMYELLMSLPQDLVIVSGSELEQIGFQTNNLPAYYLGANGNHALDVEKHQLWVNPPLSKKQKQEIHAHIQKIISLLDHDLNEEWEPISDRGAQITFSPLGKNAPIKLKNAYDPDHQKRLSWLSSVPFVSEELIVKIGGSTSMDYLHKNGHKGANVKKLIEYLNWNKNECVYFGDGLYPGGNDEAVIGIIDTIFVRDHLDTYEKLKALSVKNFSNL